MRREMSWHATTRSVERTEKSLTYIQLTLVLINILSSLSQFIFVFFKSIVYQVPHACPGENSHIKVTGVIVVLLGVKMCGLVPLRVSKTKYHCRFRNNPCYGKKLIWAKPTKRDSGSFSRVLLKISDDHPRHFFMGVPHGMRATHFAKCWTE